MPRNPGGVYSLIPGYLAVTGQTIQISQHNPVFEDVAWALTNSLDRTGAGSMLAALNMGTYRITNLGTGVNPTDAATVGQVASASPVGIVADFAGATPPVGWLLCFGQAVSRTEYAALFAVIGTTYGAGDGATTFNLPDCRDRARIGKGNMGGTAANRITNAVSGFNTSLLGAAGGLQSHILTAGQMPGHTHGISGSSASAGDHVHSVSVTGSTSSVGNHTHSFAGSGVTSANGDHNHSVTGYNPGSGFNFPLAVSGGTPLVNVPTTNNGLHQHSYSFSGNTGEAGAHGHSVTASGVTASAGAHAHAINLTSASAGNNEAHPNVQPSITFNTIIKAV